MVVRQRENGRWQARLYVLGRRVARDFATETEAEEWERKTREEGAAGTHRTPAARVSFGRVARDWVEFAYEQGKKSAPMIEHMATVLTQLIGERFPAHRVDRRIVRQVIAQLRKRRFNGHPISEQRINRYLVQLRAMYAYARSEETCSHTPPVKLFKEKPPRTETASEDDFKRLHDVASPTYKMILETARGTGCRRGEVAELGVWSLDLDHVVYVEDEPIPAPRIQVGQSAKTEKSAGRWVTIPQDLAERLRAWEPQTPEGHLFGYNGKQLQPGTITAHFRQLRKRAGVRSSLQFRDLRATRTTELLENGADPFAVRDLLGHTTIVTTQRYARFNDARVARQVFEADRRRISRRKPRRDDDEEDGPM